MIVRERTEFHFMDQNIVFRVPQIIHSVDRTTQKLPDFMSVIVCKFSKWGKTLLPSREMKTQINCLKIPPKRTTKIEHIQMSSTLLGEIILTHLAVSGSTQGGLNSDHLILPTRISAL